MKHLLELKVNKKLLRDHVSNKTGQVVTLKDIANVQTAVRGSKSRNDLRVVVEMLQKEPGNYLLSHMHPLPHLKFEF